MMVVTRRTPMYRWKASWCKTGGCSFLDGVSITIIIINGITNAITITNEMERNGRQVGARLVAAAFYGVSISG